MLACVVVCVVVCVVFVRVRYESDVLRVGGWYSEGVW